MASEVDICNLALGHLGDEASLSSIDPPEGSSQADHCAAFYPLARNAMLEAFAWSFAVRRQALALSEEESDQWEYVYVLPNPCLRPLAVLTAEAPNDSDPQPYTVETNADGDAILLTNVEDATLKYITLITDTARFTPAFVVSLSWLVASFLAGPITKNAKETERCYKMYLATGGPPISAFGNDGNASNNKVYGTFTPAHLAARQ